MTKTEAAYCFGPKSFLLATWEGGGSVAPALTVARKLVGLGHRVRVMSDACNRPEAEASGAEFIAWDRAPSRPTRDPETDPVRDWEVEGPAGLVRAINSIWAGPSQAFAEDVITELRRESADLVVTSEMLFGVAIGCEAIGQPFCYLPVNVSLFPIPGVPPLGAGLAPARTEAEAAVHAEAAQQLIGLFDLGLPAINAARRALDLPPLAHAVDQTQAARAILIATARAFDFAPNELPAGVRYVGPQLDEPAWTRVWASPWPREDRRPLVLVAFSTTFQNHVGVLQRVIDAAACLPVRVLVTLGGAVPAEALRPADNCRLADSAPHDAVMRAASLVVTHGGHGTVTRALTHRRPMLVIPHGRDQNDNAVRVTERGAGLALTPNATTAEIHSALASLLDDAAFSAAARKLGDAVARETQHSTVVEELEDLARAEVARRRCAAA